MDEVGLIPQHAIVIYPTVQGQEVYVDGTRALDKGQSITRGRVAIMHCIGWSGELGIVGDFRYVLEPHLFDTVQRAEVPDDAIDDEGRLEEWRTARGEYPISAFAYKDTDNKRAFRGDRDFYAAAARLTELVDELVYTPTNPRLPPIQYTRSRVYGYVANMGHFLSGV